MTEEPEDDVDALDEEIDEDEPEAESNGDGQLDRWGRGEDGLTPKQRFFVQEIVVDWNATQAAIRAGYSPQSAKHQGSENMQKPQIVAAVQRLMAGRVNRAEIDRSWVLARLATEHKKALADTSRAGRVDRIRIVELIGKHVDVMAFRTNIGLGLNPEALDSQWNLAALDDEELETFERLLAKISPAGDGPTGEDGTPEGEGAPSSTARP